MPADRGDDSIGILLDLQARVAQLEAMGASRWSGIPFRPVDLSSSTVQQYIQHGVANVTTNGSGLGIVTLPTAFPTATDGAIIISRDASSTDTVFSLNSFTTTAVAFIATKSSTSAIYASKNYSSLYWLAWGH